MFYDFQQKTIFVSTGEEYELKEFRSDIKKLMHFLNEMIFQLNNNSTDLMALINNLLKEISRLFLRIGRSGDLRRRFSAVICQWRDNKK